MSRPVHFEIPVSALPGSAWRGGYRDPEGSACELLQPRRSAA